jgi:hypothetical protein
MTPLIAAVCIIFASFLLSVIITLIARNNYTKFVASEKEIINNIITLINTRNTTITESLTNYVMWLNEDFNHKCTEIFMADPLLLALKEKYNMADSEYILSFSNVIADVQNLNRVKAQELLNNVSNSMIEAVKKQIGEK